MATAWIASFIANIAVVFPTSDVVDGDCYAYMFWKNQAARVFHSLWTILSFYVIILLTFVFCYWRILVVIRRQARVMAGHAASGLSAAQSQYDQIESNVIKTMILVSVCFAVSWLPSYVNFLIATLDAYPAPYSGVYYATALLGYSYMFVYAIKLDPVRKVLLRLIPCKKTSEQADGNVA